MLGLGNILTKGGALLGFPNKYSFSFDGSNDFLELSDDIVPNASIESNGITLSAWINIDTTGSRKAIVGQATNEHLDFTSGGLYIDSSNRLEFMIFKNSSYNATVSSTTFSTGVWHHVLATYSGESGDDKVRIYVDGSLETTSSALGGDMLSGTSAFNFIGKNCHPSDTNYFDGLIDEIAIWDSALDAPTIAKLGSKPVDLTKHSASNLKLWLRAGDKILPEEDKSIARSDFYTDFDGTDDFVDCGDIDTSGNFTFSCWFNADSVAGHNVIFSMSDESTSDGMTCGFFSGKGGKIYATALHGDTDSTKATSVLSTGQWYHLVVTKSSGQTETIYINGISDTASADTNWGLVDETIIGARNAGSNMLFNGKISNVALHQTILDAQTISQMAKSRFTPMRDNRFSVVDFDGSDDYIDCGDGTSLDTTSQLTLSSWVNFNSTGTNVILARDDNTNSNYILYGWSDGKIYAQIRISGVGKTVDGGSYSSNVWYHVVATFDGSSLKIYVDGDLKDTLSASGSIDNDDVSLEIGRKGNNAFHFDGSMSSVAVYNTAKSAEEIYAIYQQGITYDESSLSGLVGLWRMGDDTSASFPTIADSSSNSNDGTITNGASDDIVQQMVAGYDMGAFESTDLSDTYPAIIDVNEPVLGVELVEDSDWTEGTGWTDTGDNTWTYTTGTTSSLSIEGVSGLTVGKLFKIQYTITSNSNDVTLKWGGINFFDAGIAINSTVGTHTYYGVATRDDVSFRHNGGTGTIGLSNPTLKQVSGNVGTMTNQDSADLVYSSVLPDQSFLATGVNSAYNFIDLDGIDAKVTLSSQQSLTGDFTISGWMNREDEDLKVFFGDSNSGTKLNYLYITETTKNLGIDFQGLTIIEFSNSNPPHSEWFHFAITRNAKIFKCYVNGSLTDTEDKSSAGAYDQTWTYNQIGTYSTGNYWINASFSNFAIHDKELISTEISAIYNAGRHSNLLDSYSDNIKGYYAFGALDAITGLADTDSTIYDRSGNSNHGTPSGTATGDLKSPPNAEPNGYAKGDTNRSTTTP